MNTFILDTIQIRGTVFALKIVYMILGGAVSYRDRLQLPSKFFLVCEVINEINWTFSWSNTN